MIRAIAILGLALASVAASAPALAATYFAELWGYRYLLVTPDSAPVDRDLSLVVALHGCRQSADELRSVTRFDALGTDSGFAVLYPETRATADNPLGCWRWWAPENQVRGGAEPERILTMIDQAGDRAPIDRRRVYVVGFSSGGAMSAILGALYPDRIAAVGVHSGLPYAGAGTVSCGLRAMSEGAAGAEARATVAYHAQGPRHRVMPLMVVHGTGDPSVSEINAERLVAQFAQLNDLADDGDGDNQSADAVAEVAREARAPDGRRYFLREYHDSGGGMIIRDIRVEGMGHAWSGGPSEMRFSDPEGPDASSLLWQFLRRFSLDAPAQTTREVAKCRDRFGANFTHYWWHERMSREEYWCDPWRWTWRRSWAGAWTAGRCP